MAGEAYPLSSSSASVIRDRTGCAGTIPLITSSYITGYRIAGNFRGRKFSRISRITGYSRKYYPRNVLFFVDKGRAIALIRKNIIWRIFENFPLYSIY